MTRCRLPHGQRHSEALKSTQTRLRVANGEGSRLLLVCVCVCVCAIVLYTSVRGSANTSPLWVRGSVKRERELFALTHRVYVCVSMLQRWMWAGVHMRFIVLLRVWETVSQHLSHTPRKSTARHRSPEIHRDLMWRDGYWAGSLCSCSLWFPINTRSLKLVAVGRHQSKA